MKYPTILGKVGTALYDGSDFIRSTHIEVELTPAKHFCIGPHFSDYSL